MNRQTKALAWVRKWMTGLPTEQVPSDLFIEVSNSIDEMDRKRISILNDIDDTPEGKMLVAALGHLMSKNGYELRHIIEKLNSLVEKQGTQTKTDNQSCVSHCDKTLTPFLKAIGEKMDAIKHEANLKQEKIIQGGEAILAAAIPSMNPDDYVALEGLLVKLYMHHAK